MFTKKLLCYLLFIISLINLCSCHGELQPQINITDDISKTNVSEEYKDNYIIPDELDEDNKIELTFWAKNDTNKVQTAIYEEAIADFQTLYPNIKINIRLYNDYGKIYNDVITNISTNTTPNICITYPDHIATYLSGKDTVVKLNNLFDDKKYGFGGTNIKFDSPQKEEIAPQFLAECAFGESYFAVPFMRSSEACYVNKTLLEKLGYTLPDTLTWDFIWEVSEAAMKKDANGNFIANGQNVLIPFIYKSTDNMMIQMLKQKDAPYSNDNGEIYLFNDTTKELLTTISKHAQSRAFSTFKISSYPGNYLNKNQCIFAIDSTAGATWIGANAPLSDINKESKAFFETEVMMIPQFDIQNPKMISQGPSICIFNKQNSQEVLASWLFVQYLLTNKVQIAYSQTEGYIPVTLKAQNSTEYLDYLSRSGQDNTTYYDVKIKASKLVLDNIQHTFVTPVFNGSASLRNASGQMIENVSKSARRKETIDDKYFDTLYSDMVSLFKLNNVTLKDKGAQIHTFETNRKNTGFMSLPNESKILIVSFILIWVFIAIYEIRNILHKKRKS
ncbi:MAG: extracellular solute-binding protein [Clostridia bacterium]|nr:extracellular solute-binding protein [Clostridia bacterium]